MPYKDEEVRKRKNAQYSREHYIKNREALIIKNQERRKKQREEWYAFKSTLKCSKCGFSHPAALDFHHVDRTNHKSVFKLAKDGCYKAAMEEIKKCIVYCANCHRIHHHDKNLLLYKSLTTNQLPKHAGKC
jgi:hypothetical protein